jgi:membrane peptidoglycan carboxypeptidase
MKKYVRNTLLALELIVLLSFIYFGAVIIKARIDTPGILKKALNTNNITLKIKDLSPWQIDALLAVEDPNFYHHNGVDLKTPGAGLTTITQALVKIYYFDHFKPGLAKIKQTLIARYALNSRVSKNDQLILFINNVYLGNANGKSIIGFNNAAQTYYHKFFHKLGNDEYLSLVAMIVAPNNFNILNQPAANIERTGRIKKVISGEYKPKQLMDIYY